jgi:hypothetical protein
MAKSERPIPSIEDVAKMAPELNMWSEMAARAFGLYAGINDAIKKARDKDGSVAHHASEIRQQMILMSLIRSFAVMDRGSDVSFQSVKRFLEAPNALQQIAKSYADSELGGATPKSFSTFELAIDAFLATYRSLDFEAFKKIQSFRNTGIAHISWPDAEKAKVTYVDVERLVRGCCEMAGQLTLMLSGKNDWPWEHFDDSYDTSYSFWLSAITAQSEGRLDL